MGCHLGSFVSSNDGREVAKPLQSGNSSEAVGQILKWTFAHHLRRTVHDIHEWNALGAFVILCRWVLEHLFGHVVRAPSSESAEQRGNHGLRNDDLVVGTASFEVEELQADRLAGEDFEKVVRCHAVLADKAFEDVKPLWSEHVDTPLLEQVRVSVCCVLD